MRMKDLSNLEKININQIRNSFQMMTDQQLAQENINNMKTKDHQEGVKDNIIYLLMICPLVGRVLMVSLKKKQKLLLRDKSNHLRKKRIRKRRINKWMFHKRISMIIKMKMNHLLEEFKMKIKMIRRNQNQKRKILNSWKISKRGLNMIQEKQSKKLRKNKKNNNNQNQWMLKK